jgi:hypothetical protein
MMNHLIHDRRRREEFAAVERWNLHYPVGTEVDVHMESGPVTIKRTYTRSPAQILGGHNAGVYLEGISKAYSLSRVSPVIQPVTR